MTKNQQAQQDPQQAPAYFPGEAFTLSAADAAAVREAVEFTRQGDYSDESVHAVVRSAGNRNRRNKRDAAVARVIMAGAVHAAVTGGLVGKGCRYDTRAALAEALDVTGGTVTGLSTLGLALAKGFGPDFAEWSIASSKAGRKEVRNVVEAAPADGGRAIADALSRLFTPDGKDNGPAEPRQAASEKDGATDGDAVEVTVDPMTAIGQALAVIAAQARELSADDWSLVEDRITAIVTKEVTIRTAAAKRKSA